LAQQMERDKSISLNIHSACNAELLHDGKLNINEASEFQLLQLPYIGEQTAKLIVEYRNKSGKFQSIDELMNVNGIGPKTLDYLRPYIRIGE